MNKNAVGLSMYKPKGFTLLELLIVVVIIGVLVLIATPNLLGLVDQAKIAAIKTNMASAASSLQAKLLLDDMDVNSAAKESAEELQNAGTPDNPNDDSKNPLADSACSAQDCPAFQYGTRDHKPGIVMIEPDEENDTVNISAIDKHGRAIVGSKTVKSANSDDENTTDNGTTTPTQLPSTQNSIDELPIT